MVAYWEQKAFFSLRSPNEASQRGAKVKRYYCARPKVRGEPLFGLW